MAGSRRSPDQLRPVRIKADVDLNVVMTERGSLVEVQKKALRKQGSWATKKVPAPSPPNGGSFAAGRQRRFQSGR